LRLVVSKAIKRRIISRLVSWALLMIFPSKMPHKVDIGGRIPQSV
jgi:hypothetical protein